MGPMSKKRKLDTKVEEVNFDDDARHEFLTGFHKRKVQRAKHAQEAAEKRMREERRRDRAKLRESRAAEFKQAIEEHKLALKRLKDENDSDSSDSNPNEDDEEWDGIEEPPAVDYEAEYIDEDKYTTVTVEEMDATRDGIRKAIQGEDSEEEDDKKKETPSNAIEEPTKPVKKARKPASDKPKKKKKQFRYESKAERKLTQAKQRSSNSKKAKARREQ